MTRYLAVLALALVACNSNDPDDRRPGHITLRESFDIKPCGDSVDREDGIHYVTKRQATPIQGTMTLTYEVSGAGTIVATEGTNPRLALYFQRGGDDWSGEGKYGAYRWYTTARPALTYGTFTHMVPLSFANWTPVITNDFKTEAAFKAALDNVSRVGFTLGGSHGAGHGVCMLNGYAHVRILNFEVTP